jgi:hypothetical protein
MTANFTAITTTTLVVSLAALAIGLGPASAKDRSHRASGAYGSTVPISGAPASRVEGAAVSEPAYMAIQPRGWKENN